MLYMQILGAALRRRTKMSLWKKEKNTFALQMSHWEHIGYIYQSRKHHWVNNISVWHLLHIQKLDLQIFSSQRHVVIIKKIEPWVYTAVTLNIYSMMIWPKRMHHHAATIVSLQGRKAGVLEQLPKSCVTLESLLILSGFRFSHLITRSFPRFLCNSIQCLKDTWHHGAPG